MNERRTYLVAALIASAVPISEFLRPRLLLADKLPPLDLDRDFPQSFAEWRTDPTIAPLVPDPTLQSKLETLYSQTLARTYVDGAGQRVMLSVAYGSDQASEATAVHRPEFCYSSQGFSVKDAGIDVLSLPSQRRISVQRLLAVSGARLEPILYWIVLADKAVLPGLPRKLEQLRYGLAGQIPDGMLVRTSTVGLSVEQSFEIQSRFINSLYASIPQSLRDRVFGI